MSSNALRDVKNPFTGQVVGQVRLSTDAELTKVLATAHAAAQSWRTSTAAERNRVLTAVATDLAQQRSDFVQLICAEAGKPLRFAEAEVDRAIGVLEWAAAEALRFGGEVLRLDTTKTGRPGFGLVNRFPRGLILGITPFNFPLNLVVHKVAPAIASGNAILIKPSPFTPLTATKLAGLFEKQVRGLVTVINAGDEQSARLTTANEVEMVSFTGSARVGWLIRAQTIKKPVTLELGGNAWCVLGADVSPSELGALAKRIAGAAYGYAGQSCISVQNIAAPRALWPELKEALVAATRATTFGDPAHAAVVCGPLINGGARTRVEAELKSGGGERFAATQATGDVAHCQSLLAPTFVAEPKLDSSLVSEEIFGPVMTGRPYDDFSEVVTWINSSRYGLQTGLYSNDYALIERAYQDLNVGGLIVNDVPTTRYDHQPYGGVKDSGFGREGLRSAMDEMTEPKFMALSSTRVL